ncbi:MAG: ABC transporter permease [Oscillospiraceae bacterium]|nr:ABC transporter permease [Oscillospiraceae bacterium]
MTSLSENIRLAFASLASRKLRAFLTMLGIIIGIGSVIAIVTVGNSLTGSLTTSMQSLGANNITVSLTEKSDEDDEETSQTAGTADTFMFGRSEPDAEDLITDGMIDEYRAAYPDYIQSISLTESLGSATVTAGDDSASIALLGVNPEYQQVNEIELDTGRFIKDGDGEKRVAVVGQSFADTVFGENADPVGKTFDVVVNGASIEFYVVGVYTEDDDTSTSMFNSTSSNVYIPLAAAKKYAGADAGYESFTVMTKAGIDSTAFLSATTSFFAGFYSRNPSYTVEATNMASMLETVTEMLDTVKYAIAAIAAISLLVGGIGVMNIMLVSITERTREIGTRKALGAPNSAIRMQFIVESVIICTVGGAIGVVFGVTLGCVASNLLGYAATPSAASILIAVGFSMLIGVFFGYYPANKAAKLDPIEALRYE